MLLLRFLERLLEETDPTLEAYESCEDLGKIGIKPLFLGYLNTIKKVFKQQSEYFNEPKSKIPNRIVSLNKPYVRPIIRGKETKRVEFGVKVNMFQVDGVDFIEHPSFDAFHEGIRLGQTIGKQQRYFDTPVRQFAGDAIYATNANRRLCNKREITTSFVPKGRKAKDEKEREKMRKVLRTERATRMEGSFGTQKNHYLLGCIRAKTYHTEIAWLFFGILTANVHRIVKRAKAPPKRA
jgi:hypothetical protein